MKRKFIIDVDTGSDDAFAIMLALHQTDVDVLAITCVVGNTTVDDVCRNTLRVLDICSKPDVSIYIYIYVGVGVCVRQRERKRKRERECGNRNG